MMNKLRITLEAAFFLGTVSLLAACGGSSESGHNGTVTMPPTTGLLQSLSIAPAASSAAACSPVQYTATGHYSDGTNANVSNGVYWEIDPATSNVAIANALNGQIIGINPGSATVVAWTGQGIAASSVLNVSSDNLNALAITPASSTLAVNGAQAYSALATCSNGSIDVSRMNIWSSGSPAVATISVSGLVKAVAAGSSVIAATAGPVVASAVLNVP
jgi:hypothetical protein